MSRFRLTIVFLICLALSFVPTQAQNLKQDLQALEEALQAFNYPGVLANGRSLLASPFLTNQDSLTIFEYMLNAAYALDDTIQTRKIIEAVLRCSPTYLLNPRVTSPKIIEFFNEVKSQFFRVSPKKETQEQVNQSPPQERVERKVLRTEYLFSTILFPGSGHLLTKQKTKGYIFLATSTCLAAGIIYSAIKTETYRDRYLNAIGNADYERLYRQYNSAYKTRNALIVGYGLLSLYALYDLHAHWDKSEKFTVGFPLPNHSLSIGISKSW